MSGVNSGAANSASASAPNARPGARTDVRRASLTQVGHHLGPVDGIAPTGRIVRQINSVVYHVEDGLITEYWMQIDRAGLLAQLRDGS
ncbi:ester cyclase [Micromonospora sp. NPDC093277]|uniref:ester cyclase n=1 Tax=Micromonospora sp. NPDC093277 TaxID=3364291 RepID=UPI003817CF59